MSQRSAGRQTRTKDATALSLNVQQTARTVAAVLDSFAEALRRGGFDSGLDAYRRMADTMVNQRLWAINHGDEAAEESFQQIAAQAHWIAGLLRDFVVVMEKLASLSAIRHSLAREPAVGGSADHDRTVVAWLGSRGSGASATQIRAGTGLASAYLASVLARLEASGVVRKGGSADRPTYTLVQ
jgi:hypothetical protein